MQTNFDKAPILRSKFYSQGSQFLPENLLREARRQKDIPIGQIPAVCILDPDGDIVRHLVATQRATPNPYWACYHSVLYNFEHEKMEFGIIGCAVGAPYAVLVAEELFVSGCQLLLSITSSGQISPKQQPPFVVLIERALRDEGTSYHYLPPSDYANIDETLLAHIEPAFSELPIPVYRGTTWTTDAPFRETDSAIRWAQAAGITAVEMEAAALYAFAQARRKPVICFALVTNQMGNIEGDFEKGEANGSQAALALIAATTKQLMSVNQTTTITIGSIEFNSSSVIQSYPE